MQMKIKKLKDLIKAVRICYKGKNETLDVHEFANITWWDPNADDGFMEYKKARKLILTMPKINWILQKRRYAGQ